MSAPAAGGKLHRGARSTITRPYRYGLVATLMCAALMLAAMLAARPRLLTAARSEPGPIFVMLHGIVVLLAVLAMATFLAEGAILD